MDDFFSFIAKAVVAVPIIIVIFSLMFKFGQSKIAQNNSFNFDFNGPYKCFYKDDKIEAKIYIKNRNVLAEVDRDGLIKKYLLSPYVSIAESLIKSNFSGIESMVSQYMKRKIDIKEVIDSCKKENFNEKIFNLK